MNKDRILKLADEIEGSRLYDQSQWWIYPGSRIEGEDPSVLAQKMFEGERCGTACCLAGHALALFYEDLAHYDDMKWSDVLHIALDVSPEASFALSNAEWDCDEIAFAFDLDSEMLWSLFHQEELEDPDTGTATNPIPDNRQAAKALRLIVEHARDE